MKRINNIYDQVISIDNILLADKIARKGKGYQRGIQKFDQNYDQNIADIYKELVNKTYRTSDYTTRIIKERKERKIWILKYRDRVVQHAIMNPLEKMFVACYTKDTYSCIKGRGTHNASEKLSQTLYNMHGVIYCLKMDIRKFYPTVDNEILKKMLRKKIKDVELLSLLDSIIDSAPGLPIGNYLSQIFANFYLTYFDHWLKEKKMVKHYFRYADDIVILSYDKEYLHRAFAGISKYLKEQLKLEVNEKWQIFPVAIDRKSPGRGIDFVGYVHFQKHKLLRKTIKTAFARVIARRKKSKTPEAFRASIASYKGWAKHCSSNNLLKKLLPNEII